MRRKSNLLNATLMWVIVILAVITMAVLAKAQEQQFYTDDQALQQDKEVEYLKFR